MNAKIWLAITIGFMATTKAKAIQPPQAKKISHPMKIHDDLRNDPYYWLRDIKNPKVKAHLKKENLYFNSYFSKKDALLKKKLVAEFKSKIEEDDSTVPTLYLNYFYNYKTVKGRDYGYYYRTENKAKAKPELVLDENKKAAGKKFFAVRSLSHSPDGQKIAWCFDYDGSGKCEVEIQDLKTKKFVKPGIKEVHWGDLAWAPDSKSVFYVIGDKAWRPAEIWRFDFAATKKSAQKKLLLQEKDELFNLGVQLSNDDKFLFAMSDSFESSRVYYWDQGEFKPLLVPKEKALVHITHSDEGFFATSNFEDRNYRVYSFEKPGIALEKMKLVVKPTADAKIVHADVLDGKLLYAMRSMGNDEIHIFDLKSKKDQIIEMEDVIYEADFVLMGHPLQARLHFSSPITPLKTYQIDLQTGAKNLLKANKSPSLDPNKYVRRLVQVQSRDGKSIPIHIVHLKDRDPQAPQPTLLYGYGSYGITDPSGFRETLFSLLDRGVVFVSAHVRGSDAQGEKWYDDGKLMNKQNTFNDFVDVAEFLIKEKYTTSQQLAIRGGSAGGLLVAASMNQKPELFKAVLAEVPFVDVLTTMLDPTIPLTTQEYLQWGNPNEPKAYFYMRTYSPYDNVKKGYIPSTYVITGVSDQQVAYWEPAKWVQKLRENSQSKLPIIMKVNMGAGHGGVSGRYSKYEETAEKYIFIIKELGVKL